MTGVGGGRLGSRALQLAALVCLGAGFAAAALTAVQMSQGHSVRLGAVVTGLLLLTCCALLAAHLRSGVWQTALRQETNAPNTEETHGTAAQTDGANAGHATDTAQIMSYPARTQVETAAPSRRAEIGAVVLVTLVGAVLRLLACRHSLWYDELWTISFMRSGPVYALTHQGSYNNHLLNSFLGSLLLRLRFALTGLTPSTGAPAWWVRLPSLCAGVASVPLLYLAVRDAINRPVGLCAALLLAVSPAAIDLSAQSRGYAGVLCCGIAQAYFLGRALRAASPSDWTGWLLCVFVGVWAHLYMLFIVFVDGLLVAGLLAGYVAGKNTVRARFLLEQGLLMLAAWLCLTMVCYSGVLYALQKEFGRKYETSPMARAHEVIAPLLQLWGGLPTGGARIAFYALSALLLALGVWLLMRSRPSIAAYLLGLLIVPPALVEAAHPHFVYPRFFAFALPAFLTLIACGLWQIARTLCGAKPEGQADKQAEKQTLRLVLLGLGTLLFLLPGANGLRDVLTLPKQDYANGAAYLARAQRAGQAVAVTGAGSEYFQSYGVRALRPRSLEEMLALVRAHKTLLIADTNISVNIHTPSPRITQWLRRHASPIIVFPGRFAGWPHRWLDGDSDVVIYEVRTGGAEAK